MSFNRYIIEAKLAVDAIRPEDFPGLAMDALEAGFDGPVTRRTSILVKPSGWEVDQFRKPLMAEWGLNEITTEVACARLAQDLAREILREGKDPLLFTRTFERLWINADYPRNIQDLGTMDDEVAWRFTKDSESARLWVLERLEEIAKQPDMP